MDRKTLTRSLILSCVFALIPPESGISASPNPILSISADALLHKVKQNQPITLVDLRFPKEFDKARIRGSINLPLYAIKTKAFLKSVPFVLIEDGYRNRFLESLCRTLQNEGFKASFLMGGLNAWKQRGGPIEEDIFSPKTLNRISPQAFYQEKNDEEWIIVDASATHTPLSMSLFPHAHHIPFIDHPAPAVSAVKNRAEPGKAGLSYPFLIFNEDGNQYDRMQKIIEKAGILNVFYLQGGLGGYEAFLKHLVQSRRPRDERRKTSRQCGTCRKGQSHEGESQER
jgi:rhodanese-related sulfurtransferase